jgi:hypothetical protein
VLAGNYLDGTLPTELGDLSNLRVLNLGKNGFTDVGLGKQQQQQQQQQGSSSRQLQQAAAAAKW